MKLTIDQIERFKGQINLKKINIQGQIKLSNTKVLIIGAGGIGSPVALFLARSGIKYFEIADFDKVSKSNLHRQVLFDEKDINKNKALVTKKKISLIDKKIKVKTFQHCPKDRLQAPVTIWFHGNPAGQHRPAQRQTKGTPGRTPGAGLAVQKAGHYRNPGTHSV